MGSSLPNSIKPISPTDTPTPPPKSPPQTLPQTLPHLFRQTLPHLLPQPIPHLLTWCSSPHHASTSTSTFWRRLRRRGPWIRHIIQCGQSFIRGVPNRRH